MNPHKEFLKAQATSAKYLAIPLLQKINDV